MQTKHTSGFNKIYTQHLNGYDEATYKVSFFSDECFVRKWRLKFQVSKYRLRWNAGNDEFNYVPRKFHNYCFYEHFTTGNRLVSSWEMTQLAAPASQNYNRNNYYIRPHLDARWLFLYGGSSTTKIIFIYPCFFR